MQLLLPSSVPSFHFHQALHISALLMDTLERLSFMGSVFPHDNFSYSEGGVQL